MLPLSLGEEEEEDILDSSGSDQEYRPHFFRTHHLQQTTLTRKTKVEKKDQTSVPLTKQHCGHTSEETLEGEKEKRGEDRVEKETAPLSSVKWEILDNLIPDPDLKDGDGGDEKCQEKQKYVTSSPHHHRYDTNVGTSQCCHHHHQPHHRQQYISTYSMQDPHCHHQQQQLCNINITTSHHHQQYHQYSTKPCKPPSHHQCKHQQQQQHQQHSTNSTTTQHLIHHHDQHSTNPTGPAPAPPHDPYHSLHHHKTTGGQVKEDEEVHRHSQVMGEECTQSERKERCAHTQAEERQRDTHSQTKEERHPHNQVVEERCGCRETEGRCTHTQVKEEGQTHGHISKEARTQTEAGEGAYKCAHASTSQNSKHTGLHHTTNKKTKTVPSPPPLPPATARGKKTKRATARTPKTTKSKKRCRQEREWHSFNLWSLPTMLTLLLALLYLAVLITRQDVLLMDLLRWCRSGHIPFPSAHLTVNQVLRRYVPSCPIFLKVPRVPSSAGIRRAAYQLALLLSLQAVPFPTAGHILKRLVAMLRLPEETTKMAKEVVSLWQLTQQRREAALEGLKKGDMPAVECQAAAALLITLKMCCGLNDSSEHHLSVAAARINEAMMGGRDGSGSGGLPGQFTLLFSYDEWMRYIVEVGWLSRQVDPLCEAIAPPPVLARPSETKLMADLANLLTFCCGDPAVSPPDLLKYPNIRRHLEVLGLSLEGLCQAHFRGSVGLSDPLLVTLKKYVDWHSSSASSSPSCSSSCSSSSSSSCSSSSSSVSADHMHQLGISSRILSRARQLLQTSFTSTQLLWPHCLHDIQQQLRKQGSSIRLKPVKYPHSLCSLPTRLKEERRHHREASRNMHLHSSCPQDPSELKEERKQKWEKQRNMYSHFPYPQHPTKLGKGRRHHGEHRGDTHYWGRRNTRSLVVAKTQQEAQWKGVQSRGGEERCKANTTAVMSPSSNSSPSYMAAWLRSATSTAAADLGGDIQHRQSSIATSGKDCCYVKTADPCSWDGKRCKLKNMERSGIKAQYINVYCHTHAESLPGDRKRCQYKNTSGSGHEQYRKFCHIHTKNMYSDDGKVHKFKSTKESSQEKQGRKYCCHQCTPNLHPKDEKKHETKNADEIQCESEGADSHGCKEERIACENTEKPTLTEIHGSTVDRNTEHPGSEEGNFPRPEDTVDYLPEDNKHNAQRKDKHFDASRISKHDYGSQKKGEDTHSRFLHNSVGKSSCQGTDSAPYSGTSGTPKDKNTKNKDEDTSSSSSHTSSSSISSSSSSSSSSSVLAHESLDRLLRGGTSTTALGHTLFIPVPAYRVWQGPDFTKAKWRQAWATLPRSFRCVVEVLVILCGVTRRELLEEALAMEKVVEIYSSLLFLFPDPPP